GFNSVVILRHDDSGHNKKMAIYCQNPRKRVAGSTGSRTGAAKPQETAPINASTSQFRDANVILDKCTHIGYARAKPFKLAHCSLKIRSNLPQTALPVRACHARSTKVPDFAFAQASP